MLSWPPSALLLGSVSLVLLTVAVLELFRNNWWQGRWERREFDLSLLLSPLWVGARCLSAILLGLLAAFVYDSWAAGVAFTSAVWVAIVAVSTDLSCGKIPKETTWINLLVGTTMALMGATLAGWFSALLAGFALVLVLGLAALISRGKLGMGDIRLLLSMAPLAAWAGWTAILVGVGLAGVLQLPLRPLLRKLDVFPGTKYLPFAPAVVAGLAIAIAFLGQPSTPCDEWVLIVPCASLLG